MNKVIAAFDGLNVSESTSDYAIYLSKEFNAHIVASLLQDILYHGITNDEIRKVYEENDWAATVTLTKQKELIRAESLKNVSKKFDEKGVHYNIHKDKLIALQSLVKESHFADMILIDGNENFSDWDKSKPSHFLRNLMAEADCPLMVVPKKFEPIEKFVFAYDGSPSSLYAIRLFTYLFPVIPTQELEIVMVTDEPGSNHFPEQHLLKELLKRKYPVILQSVIKSEQTTDTLAQYLESEPKNCMVVLGAYQRSSFSRWLRQSTADALIDELDIPVFIAHK